MKYANLNRFYGLYGPRSSDAASGPRSIPLHLFPSRTTTGVLVRGSSEPGGQRAPTSTWCPLGTLRGAIWLSLSARMSTTTRSSPISRCVDAPKTESPNLTKHPTSQNQYREEVVPPQMYAPTTDNGPCHSIDPARQSFPVPDLEDYAVQMRKGRPGMINTRQS
jgi:hypothetical protein